MKKEYQLTRAEVSQLASMEFKRHPNGGFNRNGHKLAFDEHWMTVTSSKSDQVSIGEAGPWRNGESGRVFQLPAYLSRDADPGSDAGASFTSTLDWAISADANRFNGYTAPTREEILDYLGNTSLTVQDGSMLRECTIDRTEERFALRCPIVMSIPNDLPPERRAWLDELIAETQRRWRMVRVGEANIDGDDSTMLLTEIDLTGCPEPLLAGLIPVAADSLRWVVAWAARSAAVIVDTSIDSEVLAFAPQQMTERKEVATW